MAYINIDEDNDREHDRRALRRLRRHAVRIKWEQSVDSANDQRSMKRERRHSVVKREEEEKGETYALYRNLNVTQDGSSGFQDVGKCDSLDLDAEYEKFLSCLKPYQNAYVLDYVKTDATSILVPYEDVDMTSYQPKHYMSTAKEAEGGKLCHLSEQLRAISEMESIDISYKLHLMKQLSWKHGEKVMLPQESTRCQELDSNAHRTAADEVQEAMRMRTSKDKQGKRHRLAEESEPSGMRTSNDKQGKKHKLSEDAEPGGRTSVAPKAAQEADGTNIHLVEVPNDQQRKKRKISGASEKATRRSTADNVTVEPTGPNTCRSNRSSRAKSRSKKHGQPGSLFKGSGDGLVDDSYKALLSGLSEYDGHLMLRSEDGKVVIYEQDWKHESSAGSDSDSDSVIIIGDSKTDIKNHKDCSLLSKKRYFKDLEFADSQTGLDMSFRKELMNILSKPYDQKEYDSLMDNASKRRPLEGYRDLRGGRKGTYELQILGKSYLDHYEDVAKAIERSRSDHWKVLTLLRGFMFFLENIVRDGAFKPWRDKECLEVQPRRSNPSRNRKR